jgi:spore germination protein YaaH
MREVSRFWFTATGVTQIGIDPSASSDLTEEFLDDTRDALVVPSIVDGLPAGEMAAILADPETRRQHVETIVEFAQDGGYDGIDLDYEQFAFADGSDTWEATRPNWVSFVAELAGELHDDGRTLTVSIPVVYDAGRTSNSGYWVYDYGAIADHVDYIRMMAYDYSVGEPGPIAPLEFVQRAIDGAIEATGQPEKLVLGLPAYGRNWPVSVTGVCPEPDEENDITVPGVTTVTARSVDDLIERRDAVPVYDASTAEWSFQYDLEISDDTTTCVQTRQVHYVDADGVRARMDLAIAAGLGGVSLWALGFDDDDVWDAILVDATLPDPDAED